MRKPREAPKFMDIWKTVTQPVEVNPETSRKLFSNSSGSTT